MFFLFKIILIFLFNFNIFSDKYDIDNDLKNKLNKLSYKYIYFGNLKKDGIGYDETYTYNNLSEDLIIIKFEKKDIIDETTKLKTGYKYIYESKDKKAKAEITIEDGKYFFYFKDDKNSDDLERLKGNKKEIKKIEINKIGYFFKLINYKGDSNEIETEEYLFINNLDTFKKNKQYRYIYMFYEESIEIIDNKDNINDFLFLSRFSVLKNLNLNKKIITTNFPEIGKIYISYLKKLDLSNLTIKNHQNFKEYFNRNKIFHDLEEIILPEMTVTDLSECFKNCKNLKKIDLSRIKTDQPISLSSCFYDCENLEEVILPDNLKTNRFSSTFSCCIKIKNIDLKNTQIYPYIDGDTKYYNFICTFALCSSLENVDLSRIIFTDEYLKQYSTMSMFNGCNNLNTVDMRKFEFNDTSVITGAFFYSKIKNIILNNFPNKNKYCFFLNSNIKNLQLENTTFGNFKKSKTYKENYNDIENLLIDGKKVDDNERKKADEEIEEEKGKEEYKRKQEYEKLKNKEIKSNTCLKCCANCCCCCNRG